MTTTAKKASARAIAKNAGNAIDGSSSPYKLPLIMPIIKALTPVIHARIKSAQAVMVARALNICGIPPPPVNNN
jgi:hypothetical protein